ncbi:MAG: HAMP domain-containing sensor histidine kinase [Alphaproteobacteria bacterium]
MKLTRRFALIAGAIILAVCVGLGLHGGERAERNILEAGERYNVTFARLLANSLWERHGDTLFAGRPTRVDDPRLALVDHDVRALLSGLPVGKIKIYALDGTTIYSTEAKDIGGDKSGNIGFQAAIRGDIFSELQFKGSFNTVEGTMADRDVLETYVAIAGRDGKIEGAVEVYHDLTMILSHTHRAQLEQWAVTGAVLAALLGLLTLFIWRSELAMLRAKGVAFDAMQEADKAQLRERMKSEFLANVSHELRSPMNAILGFAQVIQNRVFGPMQPERYESYVNDIVDSGSYLLRTIDDILDMAKIEAKEIELMPTTVDLGDLLHRSARQVGQAFRRPDIELAVEASGPTTYVLADENRLRQVIANIVSNAVKFTRGAGTVRLVLQRAADGGVRIEVRDSGIGIEPDKLATVLTPFGQVAGAYAREIGGVGLGLPIARALVEMHDGSLDIESKPGAGTTVTLTLPASRVIGSATPLEAVQAA